MGLKALVYPVRDYNFIDLQSRSREYEHQRLKALLRLSEGECDVVIACLDAAAQLTVPKRVLLDTSVVFEQGREIPVEKAVRALTLLGYERFDAVDGEGQFSLRGGILDFFMPDSKYPVRAEFWGDEITDLSYFDIESQRRFEKAGTLRSEFVIAVSGVVAKRGGAVNENLKTGEKSCTPRRSLSARARLFRTPINSSVKSTTSPSACSITSSATR